MRALSTALVALAALALLAGCEQATPAAATGAGAAAHSGGAATTPKPQASAADPAAREAVSPFPTFDQGQTVHLTASGVRPLSLVTFCCLALSFKNETQSPIFVVFDIYKTNSGPIAPGASWQWTPHNPYSFTFHVGSDTKDSGHIQIESPNW